jgi:hypothetical protein
MDDEPEEGEGRGGKREMETLKPDRRGSQSRIDCQKLSKVRRD